MTNSGFDHLLTKDYAGAKPYFDRALVIVPNMAMAHLDLGMVYSKTGQTAAATDQFNLAIADDTAENNFPPLTRTTDGSTGTVSEIANRNLRVMQSW